MRITIILVLIALLLVLASTTAYTVDRAEYVYVTQFGRLVAVRDGAKEGGLYGKWPWPIQTVQRLDRRLQALARHLAPNLYP